jgi:hypothetical protein
MNNLVDFSLVFVSDYYPCLLENLSKMPKIAGQTDSSNLDDLSSV